MNMNTTFFFLLLSISIICSSCSDSNTSTNSNSGDGVTGTLRGRLTLYDGRGKEIVNKSGILVQCEGLPYSALTDKDGKWELRNLPTRTYSLSFTKEGFTTLKNTSYGFIAGGIVEYPTEALYEPARYTFLLDAITLGSATDTSSTLTTGMFYAHTSADTPGPLSGGVIFVAGHSPTMNIADPNSNQTIAYATVYNPAPHDTTLNIQIPFDFQKLSNFTSGETIYFQAYPYITLTSYYDIVTEGYVTSGYGKGSNVLTAVMP